jgi:hypothetical protein
MTDGFSCAAVKNPSMPKVDAPTRHARLVHGGASQIDLKRTDWAYRASAFSLPPSNRSQRIRTKSLPTQHRDWNSATGGERIQQVAAKVVGATQDGVMRVAMEPCGNPLTGCPCRRHRRNRRSAPRPPRREAPRRCHRRANFGGAVYWLSFSEGASRRNDLGSHIQLNQPRVRDGTTGPAAGVTPTRWRLLTLALPD